MNIFSYNYQNIISSSYFLSLSFLLFGILKSKLTLLIGTFTAVEKENGLGIQPLEN